jgi:DNA mismatch repair protein MutS2
MVPSGSAEQVSGEQALTAEAKRLLEAGVGFEFSQLADLGPALDALSEGGAILEPAELQNLGKHLRLARLLRTGLELRRDDYPLLWDIAQGLAQDRRLEEDIERSFEPDGTVSDRASSELHRIRREKEAARERVHRKLEEIMAASGQSLQEPLVTMREGRYVLPVRAEARTRFKGIVHDTSASGATAFMEPLATVELNNHLRQLGIDEQREVERILRAFSARVLESIDPFRRNLTIIARLDLLLARGRLNLEWNCVRPLISEGGYLKLDKARHPAIGEPVPLDLELGDGRTAMVITGPNTGGKTVVLKTVGLLALMHQSGLFVPAEEGTAMPVFDGIFADIGDEQSISQSLSTFSSHVTRIASILSEATPRSLVLLDEIGVGTEPGEGAALAMEVLGELAGRGCLVLSTTHYAALKAFVQDQPAMVNAAMQFDRERLAPTYRLVAGLPGASFGLEIAARLGLPDKLVTGARGRLDSGAVRLEELIAHIERVKRELEESNARAAAEAARAEELAGQYQTRLKLWKQEERELYQRARAGAEEVLAKARSAAEQAVALVRAEQGSKDSIKRSRQMLAEAGQSAGSLGGGLTDGMVPVDNRKMELVVGQEVYLPMTNGRATVASLPDASGRLKVQAGSVWMTVRRDQIQTLVKQSEAEALKSSAGYEPVSSFPPELHLLGMRADEALEKLDRYLDEAVYLGVERVRIVHGKGTGALRRAVKESLSKDPRIKSHRLGQWNEGQDGVTVAELK